jgi:hypothetical protein
VRALWACAVQAQSSRGAIRSPSEAIATVLTIEQQPSLIALGLKGVQYNCSGNEGLALPEVSLRERCASSRHSARFQLVAPVDHYSPRHRRGGTRRGVSGGDGAIQSPFFGIESRFQFSCSLTGFPIESLVSVIALRDCRDACAYSTIGSEPSAPSAMRSSDSCKMASACAAGSSPASSSGGLPSARLVTLSASGVPPIGAPPSSAESPSLLTEHSSQVCLWIGTRRASQECLRAGVLG